MESRLQLCGVWSKSAWLPTRKKQMSDWRNEPATEKQKEKLRFFRCTWDEGITKGQASDAIDECVKKFPDWEFMYQNRPATEEQKALLRSYGKRPLHTITYARARDIIKQCEWSGWQKDISKSVAQWEKQNPRELHDEHFEKPLPTPSSGVGWRIFRGVLIGLGKIFTLLVQVFVYIFIGVLAGLLASGKSRRRRK